MKDAIANRLEEASDHGDMSSDTSNGGSEFGARECVSMSGDKYDTRGGKARGLARLGERKESSGYRSSVKRVKKKNRGHFVNVGMKLKSGCSMEAGKVCSRCRVLKVWKPAKCEHAGQFEMAKDEGGGKVSGDGLEEYLSYDSSDSGELNVVMRKLEDLRMYMSGVNSKLDSILRFIKRGESWDERGGQEGATDAFGSGKYTAENIRNPNQEAPSELQNKTLFLSKTLVQKKDTQTQANSVGLAWNSDRLKNPPFLMLNALHVRFFRKATSDSEQTSFQSPSAVARASFLNYFHDNEALCIDLCKEFLLNSHFWIIPGGIKVIDREYIERHPLISSVFIVLAMGFAQCNKYKKEQEELYPLILVMLNSTLTMTEPLTGQDMEAILYCCMFDVLRRSKRYRQSRFHILVLCNFGIDCLMSLIDFHAIKERVMLLHEYESNDLYHLRILNSLTVCRLQYAIGCGQFTILEERIKDFNNLTSRFPQSHFGDDIKLGEMKLAEVVTSILMNHNEYFRSFTEAYKLNCKYSQNHEPPIITFPELECWLRDWNVLLSKDGSGILLFSYHFYYLMIIRAFLEEFKEYLKWDLPYQKTLLKTMKYHCFSLLNGFLNLPPPLIKGAPIASLNQLVFPCLTMSDFLHCYELSERQEILNTCTKVYWHLSTIGEKSNEATTNVGKIIKSIIETGKNKKFSSDSVTTPLEPLDSENVPQEVRSDADSNSQPGLIGLSSTSDKSVNFTLPDVDQFNSFEEFFQDFFNNLKPNTKKMFPSI